MSDFLSPSIQTKTEFKNWILRQLGFPTITPELSEEQLDDCINDALEEFTEYAAQDKKYFALNLKDYIPGKGYIMPSEVVSVTELWDQGVNGNTQGGINPFSLNYMAMNGGFVPNPFSGLGARSGWFDYHLALSWIDLAYQMSGKGFEYDYNPRTRCLILHPDPIKYFKLDQSPIDTYGHHVVVECYCIRPEDENYGEVWVKRMALAMAKILIGNIRTTYSGISMLGGATIDGQQILSQGTAERDALRSELTLRYPSLGIWVG
jgi:hypothetical protein